MSGLRDKMALTTLFFKLVDNTLQLYVGIITAYTYKISGDNFSSTSMTNDSPLLLSPVGLKNCCLTAVPAFQVKLPCQQLQWTFLWWYPLYYGWKLQAQIVHHQTLPS